MKLAALAIVAAIAAGGCTPLETIDRFDGEFGAAKEKRRVLALASPT
jgi:hypothetical protein